MSPGGILILMAVLFLAFGYMGVPVSFALMAGVFVATAFTPVSLQSMVGQLFHGIDSETLLAVPFFLLVGLFTLEQLVNGWRHGFEGPEDRDNLPEFDDVASSDKAMK